MGCLLRVSAMFQSTPAPIGAGDFIAVAEVARPLQVSIHTRSDRSG